MAIVKCNFMLNDEVKAWYKNEAEKYGLSMSGLMSFVLAQYKKNEESKQVLAEISAASRNMDASYLEDLKEIVSAIKEE